MRPILRLCTLVVIAGCDPAPRDITDTLEGVRYTLRLPAGFTRTEIPTHTAHLYMGPDGAGVTVTFASPLPADLEQLYRHTGARKFDGTLQLAEWHRLETTADGFVGEMTTADATTTKVFVMRREGPHQLVCSGEAGHRHTPVAPAARPMLAAICDSFHVAP